MTYRPAVWCVNQGCHAPYPADLSECPECGTSTLPPVSVPRGARMSPVLLIAAAVIGTFIAYAAAVLSRQHKETRREAE